MAEYVRCRSYNFWSGLGSDIQEFTLPVTLMVVLVGWYLHHQCHVEAPSNCRRIGHRVPGTSEYACGEHHPHGQRRRRWWHREKAQPITAGSILRHHEESGA